MNFAEMLMSGPMLGYSIKPSDAVDKVKYSCQPVTQRRIAEYRRAFSKFGGPVSSKILADTLGVAQSSVNRWCKSYENVLVRHAGEEKMHNGVNMFKWEWIGDE